MTPTSDTPTLCPACSVAVLFAQRVLENMSMEVLVVLCNKAVEWAASSTGSNDRLLRALNCGLRATMLNGEFMQTITQAVSVSGRKWVVCSGSVTWPTLHLSYACPCSFRCW